MARVVVDVMLKPEILDPQGRAVMGALGRLGLAGVTSVRQGKRFEIEIDGDLDADLTARLDELAGSLLSNPVIEDYQVYEELAEEPGACDCGDCDCGSAQDTAEAAEGAESAEAAEAGAEESTAGRP